MFGIRLVSFACFCAATLLSPGCTGGGTSTPVSAGDRPSEVVVVADWNDVEAAAIVAVGKCEAVITSTQAHDTEQTFEIQTIMDESGTIIARRGSAAGSGEGIPITLTCSVGTFGDAARERCVLDGMVRRLKDLKGVDYRPLR